MIYVIWEFVARPEAVRRFRTAYGADGEWVRLFAGHSGYEGTTLVCDAASPRRFLTIDRWRSADDFARMRAAAAADYAQLDALCADLTESEREVGVFHES